MVVIDITLGVGTESATGAGRLGRFCVKTAIPDVVGIDAM